MANPGKNFNTSDFIVDGSVPRGRLILAGWHKTSALSTLRRAGVAHWRCRRQTRRQLCDRWSCGRAAIPEIIVKHSAVQLPAPSVDPKSTVVNAVAADDKFA